MLYVCIYPVAFTTTNRIAATKSVKIKQFRGYKCPSDKCNLCLRKNLKRKGGAML